MDIHACVEELDGLVNEMKRLRTRMKFLKKRKEECEAFVDDYIKSNNHPGIRYKDMVIIPKVKKSRVRGSQEEQKERVMGVLQKYNMANDEIIRELMDANKGFQKEREVLYFTKQ